MTKNMTGRQPGKAERLARLVGSAASTVRALVRDTSIKVETNGVIASYDHRTRTINLPAWKLREDDDPRVIDAFRGTLDHESAHAVLTDYAATDIAVDAWKAEFGAEDWRKAFAFLNVFEDARIERVWGARFPGSVRYFDVKTSYYVDKIRILLDDGKIPLFDEITYMPLLGDRVTTWSQDAKDLATDLAPLIARGMAATTTAEAADAAADVWRAIKSKTPPPPPPEPQPEEPQDEPEEPEEPEEPADSQDQGDEPDEPQDGDQEPQEPQDGDDQDNDDQPAGDDGDDTQDDSDAGDQDGAGDADDSDDAAGDGGEEDGDGPGDCEDSGSESPESEEPGEGGSDTDTDTDTDTGDNDDKDAGDDAGEGDQGSDDEGQDRAQEPGEGSDSTDEPGESEEAQEGQGEPSGDDTDTDTDTDGDDGDLDGDDVDGETEEADGELGDVDEGDNPDEDEEGEGWDIDADPDEDGEGEEIPAELEVDDMEARVGMGSDRFPELAAQAMSSDFGEIPDVGELIAGEVLRDPSRRPYTVHPDTRACDQWKTFDAKERGEGRPMAAALRKVMSMEAAQMAALLRRVIQAAKASLWVGNLEDGEDLDMDALPGIALGRNDPAIFGTHIRRTDENTFVGVLVDCSGSMGTSGVDARGKLTTKAGYAAYTAMLLHDALRTARVDHTVLGFTTCPAPTGGRQEAAPWGMKWSRVRHAQLMFEFVPAPGLTDDGSAIPFITGTQGNLDGEAVLEAAKYCIEKAQDQSRIVLFVVSDGYPAGADDNAAGKQHLITAVEEVRDAGVEVYGIGIGCSPDFSRVYYPNEERTSTRAACGSIVVPSDGSGLTRELLAELTAKIGKSAGYERPKAAKVAR